MFRAWSVCGVFRGAARPEQVQVGHLMGANGRRRGGARPIVKDGMAKIELLTVKNEIIALCSGHRICAFWVHQSMFYTHMYVYIKP